VVIAPNLAVLIAVSLGAGGGGHVRACVERPTRLRVASSAQSVMRQDAGATEMVESSLQGTVKDGRIACIFQKASAAHRGGQLEEAEAAYRALVAACPTHADGLHQLGALLVQSQTSKESCSTSCSLLDEALALLRRAVQAAPNAARYRRSLGTALEAAQLWNDAADAYRRAIDKDPADAQAWMRLARVLKTAGRPAAAVEAYRGLLALQPTHPTAHHKLGSLLRQLGRYADAAEAYKQHLAIEPGSASAAFWLDALNPKTQQPCAAGVPPSMVASLFDQ
jgi:tetratricopeptide (TPR) repeat protein